AVAVSLERDKRRSVARTSAVDYSHETEQDDQDDHEEEQEAKTAKKDLHKLVRKLMAVGWITEKPGIRARHCSRNTVSMFDTVPQDEEREMMGSILGNSHLMRKTCESLQSFQQELFGHTSSFCAVRCIGDEDDSEYSGTEVSECERIMNLAVKVIHQTKWNTLRMAWAKTVKKQKDELRDCRSRFEELQKRFKDVRTEYLNEVTTLRDQTRVRGDPDSYLQSKTGDVVSFYDPASGLSAAETEFLLKAVKEKLTMIFETNPTVVPTVDMGQLQQLKDMVEGQQVAEMKQALAKKTNELFDLKRSFAQRLAKPAAGAPAIQEKIMCDLEEKVAELRCDLLDCRKEIKEKDEEVKVAKTRSVAFHAEREELNSALQDAEHEGALVKSRTAQLLKKLEEAESREAEKDAAENRLQEHLSVVQSKNAGLKRIIERSGLAKLSGAINILKEVDKKEHSIIIDMPLGVALPKESEGLRLDGVQADPCQQKAEFVVKQKEEHREVPNAAYGADKEELLRLLGEAHEQMEEAWQSREEYFVRSAGLQKENLRLQQLLQTQSRGILLMDAEQAVSESSEIAGCIDLLCRRVEVQPLQEPGSGVNAAGVTAEDPFSSSPEELEATSGELEAKFRRVCDEAKAARAEVSKLLHQASLTDVGTLCHEAKEDASEHLQQLQQRSLELHRERLRLQTLQCAARVREVLRDWGQAKAGSESKLRPENWDPREENSLGCSCGALQAATAMEDLVQQLLQLLARLSQNMQGLASENLEMRDSLLTVSKGVQEAAITLTSSKALKGDKQLQSCLRAIKKVQQPLPDVFLRLSQERGKGSPRRQSQSLQMAAQSRAAFMSSAVLHLVTLKPRRASSDLVPEPDMEPPAAHVDGPTALAFEFPMQIRSRSLEPRTASKQRHELQTLHSGQCTDFASELSRPPAAHVDGPTALAFEFPIQIRSRSLESRTASKQRHELPTLHSGQCTDFASELSRPSRIGSKDLAKVAEDSLVSPSKGSSLPSIPPLQQGLPSPATASSRSASKHGISPSSSFRTRTAELKLTMDGSTITPTSLSSGPLGSSSNQRQIRVAVGSAADSRGDIPFSPFSFLALVVVIRRRLALRRRLAPQRCRDRMALSAAGSTVRLYLYSLQVLLFLPLIVAALKPSLLCTVSETPWASSRAHGALRGAQSSSSAAAFSNPAFCLASQRCLAAIMSYLCSLTTLAAAHPDLPGQWGAWLPVWWPSKCKPVRSCSSSAPVPPGCARDSLGSPAIRAGLAIALWVGGRRLARRRSRVPLSQGFGLFELPEGGAPGGLDATKHDELLVDFEGLVLWLGKLSCQAGEFILDYRALDRRLTRLLRRLRARGVELRFLSAGSPNSSTDSTLTDATDLPPALVQDQVRATLWRHGARLHHCSISADQLLQSLASEFPAVPVLSRGLDGALLISGSTFLKKQEELELLALTSPNQSRREKLAMVGRDPDTEAQATSGGSVVEAAVASAEARGLVTCTTTCSGRLWSAHASQSEQLSVQLLAGSPGPAARRASAEGLDQEEAGSLRRLDQQHPKSPEPLLVAMRRELPVGTRAWLLERALRLASLGDDSWPEQWAELAKQLLLRAKASRVSEAAGLVSDTAELVVADPGSNFGIAAATAGFLAVQAASTGSPLLPEELEALAWTVEFSKPGRQARELRAAVNEILDDLTQSSSEPEAESPESSVAGADARLDVADAFQETLSNAGHLGWLLGVAQPWLLEPRQSFDEALFRRLLAAFLPSSGGAAELRRRLGGAGGPGGGIRSVQSPGRLKRPGQLARPATETTVVGAGLAATRAARLARLLACTSPLAGDDEREEEEKLVDLRAREEELQREVLAPPRQQLAVEPWSAEADGVSADVADDAEDLSVRASTLADSADTSADEIADKSSSAGAPMAISTSQPRQADAPPGSNWYVPQKPVFIAAPQPVTAADLATDLQPQTTGKKKKKKKKKKTKKPQESAETKAGLIDGSTSNNLAQKVAEEQGKAKPGGTGSSNLAQKVAEKQGKAKPGGPASSNPSQKVAEKQGKAKSGGSASSNLAQEVSDKVKSAAPQEARAQTASELVPGGGTACAQCGARQSKDNFSKNQWSLKEGLRKCKTCVGAENQGKAKPEKPEPSNPSQKVAEKQGKAKPGGPASSNPSQKVAEKLGNAKPGGPASNLAQKVAEKLGKAKPVQEAEPRAKQRGGFAEAYDDLWNSARQDQDLAWDPERKASIASDQAWAELDMEPWPEDLARAGKPASIASNQAWADNYQIFLEDLAREGKPASIASDQAWAELDMEQTWPEDLARAVKPASIASDQAWAELDMEQTWPEDLARAVKPASIASDQAWAELDMDQTWPEDLTRAVKPASIATDQAWAELDMEQTWPEDLARAVKPASIATDQAWAELDMEQTWPEDLAQAVKPASISTDQAWAELDMEQTWPEDLARAVKPASIASDQAWAELDMEQTWPEDLARAVKPASIAASDQAWAELDMEQTWPEDLARAVKPELEDQEDEEELEEELRRQMEEELLPRLQNLSKEPLPIEAWREEISRRVRQQRVTVLVGATGCGKSTKLPQYLVDEPGARVLVTQPRRMAAVEIARRVASERGEALGQNVGYRIGGETLLGSGKLQFATIGYVLAWFLGKPEAFSTFTHIVIDEVHERSADMELFLLLTKLLMHFFKGPKVILMSATIQAEVFTKYFLDFIDEQSMAPVVVPGRTFPVREVYLDELVEETEWCHSLPRTALDGAADAVKAYEEACEGNKASGKPAMKPGLAELALRLVPLLAKPDSTLLVFLPGLAEIGSLSNLFSSLEVSPPSSGAAGRYKVFVMHSTVPRSEQAAAFKPPRGGVCHVVLVLASNIAESSLTLPDVTAVIDFGLHREVTHDAKQGLSSLSLAWCSQASAKQRAGRAGRTQPGIAVRLFPRRFFEEKMPEYDTPEILRTSLSKLFLRAKKLSKVLARSGDAKIPLLDDGLELDLKSAQAILGYLPQPPDTALLGSAISELAAAGALAAEDEAAEVTSLGAPPKPDAFDGSLVTLQCSCAPLFFRLVVLRCLLKGLEQFADARYYIVEMC
ncbi:unnamed protein product, partial [Polarella glacialis]